MLAMSKTGPFGRASWEALSESRAALLRGRNFKRTHPGGEYRDRTGDLLVANQALSQLS